MSKKNQDLTDRELYVVYMNLYCSGTSLWEIGNVLGVSRERVRQLHVTGTRKLREHLRGKKPSAGQRSR